MIARLSAAGAMALVVLGVPVGLSRWGWPLPGRWPNWSVVSVDVHTGYLPTSFATHLALVAAWAAWAFIAYEITAESANLARHAVSRRSRALGPLQPVLAKLVATAVLSLPAGPPLRLGGSPPSPAVLTLPVTSLATQTEPLQPASTPPAAESGGLERGGPLPTYVVVRGDTLWGIAERHLGDPTRWTEIAALNRDRPEGSKSFGNPHWIYPGWVLSLPADATGLPSQAPTPAPRPSSQPTPAEAPPPAGPTVTPIPTPPGAPPVASGGNRTSPDPASSQTRPVLHSPAPSSDRNTRDADVIGLGLLGLGLVGVLTRMRRAQQRHRRLGRRIALPTGETAATEAALVGTADDADWINRGLRLLGVATRTSGAASPPILGVRLSPQHLDVLLDGDSLGSDAAPVPPAFEACESGLRLSRGPEEALALAVAASDLMPAPALVSIGRDNEDLVLANLEPSGLVSITGDGVAACELAAAMALELATAPWVDGLDLHVVGMDRLHGLFHLHCAEDLFEIASEVEGHVAEVASLLVEAGVGSVSQARIAEPDPVWAPMVVIFTRPPTEAERALILAWTETGLTGAAVVVPADLGERGWRMAIDSNGLLQVPGLGTDLVAQRVSTRQLTGIGDLLGVAARLDDIEADDLLSASRPAKSSAVVPDKAVAVDDAAFEEAEATDEAEAPDEAVAAPEAVADHEGLGVQEVVPVGDALSDDADLRDAPTPDLWASAQTAARPEPIGPGGGEVEIGVLGSIQLRGTVRPPERPKTLELLAWLALHPDGGDTDQVVTALWPDGRPSTETVTQRSWDARAVLGLDATGRAHLPKHRGKLALGPGVRSDWARFAELSASSKPEDWREALALVRGEPLAQTDFRWATGILANMVSAIVDVGARLGQWALEAGDAALATWAGEQSLLACPYDERPYRLLMRAAHASGNRLGVKAVMERLARVLEADVEPYDFVHPETVELYRSLVGRGPMSEPDPNTTSPGVGPEPEDSWQAESA